MKSRRVMITFEVETEAPLRLLRSPEDYTVFDRTTHEDYFVDIVQCQVNVVKKGKGAA